MNHRKSSIMQKLEQQLQSLRAKNSQLITIKLSKKKMDFNGRYDKKFIHNLLNSLLQGDIISEDLFNEFWGYYFNTNATLVDVINAYNNSLLILIDKIIKNNNKISELTRERDRLKQNHDFKGISLVNTDLEALNDDNKQFQNDLKEFSKPFQLDFTQIIDNYKQESIKNTKTSIDNLENEAEKDETDKSKNLFDIIVSVGAENINEEMNQEQEGELTHAEKYHRFIIYLTCIVFVLELSMSFNKYNYVDIILGLVLLGNSLLENYLLKRDVMNRLMEKLQINFIEDKLTVVDIYSPSDLQGFIKSEKSYTHNYQNYANSSFCLLIVAIIWDSLWLIIFYSSYYTSESNEYFIQTMSDSFWKYNRYILFGSIFMLLAKTTSIIFLFQVSTLSLQKIFTKFNGFILTIRFWEINEVILYFTYNK